MLRHQLAKRLAHLCVLCQIRTRQSGIEVWPRRTRAAHAVSILRPCDHPERTSRARDTLPRN
jgi:hypothetical protein